MGLLRRYQKWHCEKAIKLYTLVGEALASEIAYCAGHTLKDPRAHNAIRTMVEKQKVFGFTPEAMEHNLKVFETYMDAWMKVWFEHSATYQAWHADPDEVVEDDDAECCVPEMPYTAQGPLGSNSFVF